MNVGIVGGWIDFDSGWSGITGGLARGLREHDAFEGFRNVTPPALPVRLARKGIAATGRPVRGWLLSPEVAAITRATAAWSRARSPWSAAGWVQISSVIGRPIGGRYVTLEDMSVNQIKATAPLFGNSGFSASIQELPASRFDRWRRLQADVYRHAYACCVTSTWARESLVADFHVPEAKIHVVGWGRNNEIPPPEKRDWSIPRLLWVGMEWRRKNGDAVVRAFRRLRADFPLAELHVVGDHPELEIEGVSTHGVLSFRDPEQAERLRSLFQACTCFVLPSLVEPFAIAYLEAAGAGMPVVASAVGGARDLFDGDAGFIVDPGDDEAIYAAVRTLADPGVAAEMGAVAAAKAAPYTWGNLAGKIIDILS